MTATARLEMRMSDDSKELIERAAAALEQSVSAFALTTLIERAHEVVAGSERTLLSKRDRDRFLSILNDDKPNANLVIAAKRIKARHAKGR